MQSLAPVGVLARLRELLAHGATFRQASAELKRPHRTLYDWAERHKLPHRQRGLPRRKQRAVQRAIARGGSIYQIARETGVSTWTAWRYANLLPLKRLKGLTQPLPCKPWRCPKCGALLNLSVCVADGSRKPARTAKRLKG